MRPPAAVALVVGEAKVFINDVQLAQVFMERLAFLAFEKSPHRSYFAAWTAQAPQQIYVQPPMVPTVPTPQTHFQERPTFMQEPAAFLDPRTADVGMQESAASMDPQTAVVAPVASMAEPVYVTPPAAEPAAALGWVPVDTAVTGGAVATRREQDETPEPLTRTRYGDEPPALGETPVRSTEQRGAAARQAAVVRKLRRALPPEEIEALSNVETTGDLARVLQNRGVDWTADDTWALGRALAAAPPRRPGVPHSTRAWLLATLRAHDDADATPESPVEVDANYVYSFRDRADAGCRYRYKFDLEFYGSDDCSDNDSRSERDLFR
mmetsp:Transcript_22106/g.69686  ORF Transcript_22106/g.69686 Transcript_22106/m.69686 type:complete len:324 (-) Transcript_22106:150-1121(-)